MLNNALDQVEAQIRARALQYATSGDPSLVNAVAEDNRRLIAIAELRQAWADPTRAKAIEDARVSAATAGVQNANDAADSASGAARASAAGKGMLGSSAHRVTQGQVGAARDEARLQAVTAADDMATRYKQGDEDQMRALLSGVLAPTGASGAYSGVLDKMNQTRIDTNDMIAGNNDMYRSALSQAIGGFISKTGKGVIGLGFQNAMNQNNANDSAWLGGGQQGPKPEPVTWSLSGGN